MKVDLAVVARDLKLPPEKIEKTVELLDEGNTISFITRFRKDLTGGLDEQQILSIQERVGSLRALSERKVFVVKSIDSQGKLTDELNSEISKATTSRRLEDLYLPFKPKKQSRALVARQQGLEPLADDVFKGVSPDNDLATLATQYVRVDKGLNSVDDVFNGVRDLLAERLGESDEVRSMLRRIMWNDGKLATQLIVSSADEPSDQEAGAAAPEKVGAGPEVSSDVQQNPLSKQVETKQGATPLSKVDVTESPELAANSTSAETESSPQPSTAETASAPAETPAAETPAIETPAIEAPAIEAVATETPATETPATETPATETPATETPATETPATETPATETPATETPATETPATETPATETPATETPEESKPGDSNPAPSDVDVTSSSLVSADAESSTAVPPAAEVLAKPKKKKKKKKKKKVEDPFKDFHDFKQPLKQIPHHRVLAINRGERAGKLKVRVDVAPQKLKDPTLVAMVPESHPYQEFMQKCATDALTRIIVPSLEREIRRELTEAAEKHAVEVFASNLRNLLLQPPVRNRTVIAIDPGFKRGCSVAVVDACGNVLDSGHIFVVGNQTRREEGKQKLVDWIKNNRVSVIAIGNGAACRQAEQLVSDIISEHFANGDVRYAMVNEAGASVYSTSEIGREELPDASPSIRSAISIARRLQDPLSELVKIAPANIGVGMYQHDVKAKHLSDSLDNVVEFCVNQVGVNVNTASPSLLKYVSGLNALTARRLVEYRQANGVFKNREELKNVSGVGDATFVQAAGFLRIHGGDTPLDSTSIHPESYLIAGDVLKRANASLAELFVKPVAQEVTPATAQPAPTDAKATGDASKSDGEAVEAVPDSSQTASTSAEIELALPSVTDENPDSPVQADVEAASSVEANAVEANTVEANVVEPEVGSSSNESAPEVASESPTESSQATESPTDVADKNDSSPAPTSAKPTTSVDLAKTVVERPRQADLAKRKEVLKRMSELDIDQISTEHSAGRMLVKDILMSLKRPDWDPRGKSKKLIFRSGIIKADDLKPEMQLDGQVVNVVDFGVFVDIGLGESSLVHVSQLSNHFVRDPHQLFAVGDVLRVWVSEIDTERRRVKLTAVRPGSKKPAARRRKKYEGKNESNSTGAQRSAGSEQSGKRPGRFDNKFKGKGKTGSRSYSKGSSFKDRPPRRSRPKPVKPITDGMLQGKEPMRSFSDLAQFVKKTPDKKADSKKQPKNES
ncbi:MAG: Tex-like N-terminal domain-containing protein [Mariniblastus sp.]|nr:Tex-like N-terminal domain-containing protein [Mariniblastus sp.]